METKTLSYRVIIEPDTYPDTGKRCFSVFCPTLGLADYGDTIEEALKNINSLIKFHLKSLLKEGKRIPTEDLAKGIIATTRVALTPPKGVKLALG